MTTPHVTAETAASVREAFVGAPPPRVAPMPLEPQPTSAGLELTSRDLDKLRSIRADVQALQAIVQKVRRGDARRRDYGDYITKTVHSIKADLDTCETDVAQRAGGRRDDIHHLKALWDQVDSRLDVLDLEAGRAGEGGDPQQPAPRGTAGAGDPDTIIQAMAFLDDQCRQFILEIGLITIPRRLQDWVALERPGHTIPFHTVFADEIPTEEDRVKVLEVLALEPPAGALIEPDTGLVYRYSRDVRVRARNIALLLGAFLAATGIVVAAYYLLIPNPSGSYTWTGAASLLLMWAALLVGVAVHVGVAANKRAQLSAGRRPVRAIGDLPLLLDARGGEYMLKLLLALVGLFGLIFLAGGEANANVGTAFLVGYSLDSFVELFTTQVEQRSASLLGGLKK